MTSLVSILIPVYNAERWVAETLESVLAQTWRYKEVIVVDDGSKDASVEIIKRYEASNVKIIKQNNSGASVARNTALKEAQGDFIQYLDADDLLSPNKIESQIRVLEQNPPNMLAISSRVSFHDEEGMDQGVPDTGEEFVDTDEPLQWLINLLGSETGAMVPIHSWLTPRRVIDVAGPWDAHPSPDDDGEYFARVVLASTGIRCVGEATCYYRLFRSRQSWSKVASELMHWGALRSLDLKAQHILALTNAPRVKQILIRHYINRVIASYPIYPRVAEAAMHRAKELQGGAIQISSFGGNRSKFLIKLLGWKTARKVSFYAQAIRRNRYVKLLKAS